MQLALSVLIFLVAYTNANLERAAESIKNVGLGFTSTYTQIVTCTKSVAKVCPPPPGRRRRDILSEDDLFSPSAVQGVEATSFESETRTLDSQLLEFQFKHQEIQSAIENNGERQNRQLITFPIATFSAFAQISLVFRTVTPHCSAPGKSFQCPQL